ncbi:WS/DGAT domain-containing protein [Streptacidiphilus monticola]
MTGNQLSGYLVTLPCGEPDPLRRLARVSADMAEHKRRGPKRGAGAMALLTDRAPAASMRLAAPWLRPTAPLLFDALVTTVPLPDVPLTLAGAPLTAVHPLPPLPSATASGSPSAATGARSTWACTAAWTWPRSARRSTAN